MPADHTRRALDFVPPALEHIRRPLRRALRLIKSRRSGGAVISRAEWKARQPTSRSPMSSTDSGLFVHHTVGGAPTTEDAEKQEMRNLQSFHMNSRGWPDLGYSFVVAPSGRIYEGRGKNVAGAHTYGFNSTAYGVAVMGNYEQATPPAAVIKSLRWLRREYLGLGDRPVRGHKDVNNTSCPGKNLYSRIGEL